jgi:cyclopropane-fatty-acyl-phospholipid synthase
METGTKKNATISVLQSLRLALFQIFYRIFLEYLVEKNLVPDFILRAGIRYNLRTKCLGRFKSNEDELQYEMDFIRGLKTKAVAVETNLANEQHYEVPTELYLHCLGSKLKYSCCLYELSSTSRRTLNEAEVKMMELYCERGEFKDGQEVLELGCGWGSLSLFLAEKYPNSRITAVSNSKTQKEFIDLRARERNITNLQIITQDLNVFKPPLG